jgi:hypothetical protein
MSDVNSMTGNIQKGNVLIFKVCEFLNNKPHSEDFLFEEKSPLKSKVLDNAELLSIISHADESKSVLKSNLSIKDYLINLNRSLCVIKPDSIINSTLIDSFTGKFRPRIYFSFGGLTQDFSCTDIHWRALVRTEGGTRFQRELLEKDNVYFVIGLTRIFKDDYWPMIVGIYPIPCVEIDYQNL